MNMYMHTQPHTHKTHACVQTATYTYRHAPAFNDRCVHASRIGAKYETTESEEHSLAYAVAVHDIMN